MPPKNGIFGILFWCQHDYFVGWLESDLSGSVLVSCRFQQLKNKVALIEKTGNRAPLKTCLNLVITGNPGEASHRSLV